jgi:MaoC like domain/short chain dehydrogenase
MKSAAQSASILQWRRFSTDDQMAFSLLSGDFNPLHIDEVIARRSMAGGIVVHGIHLLMWALDCWCTTFFRRCKLTSLDVEFLKPVRVGDLVCLSGFAETNAVDFTLYVDELLVATIKGSICDSADVVMVSAGYPAKLPPINLDGKEIATAEGRLDLMLDVPLASVLMPSLIKFLPQHQLAFMLASTRLVGMVCPGLHSLFSELHFNEVKEMVVGDGGFNYKVKRFDQRFSLATIQISSEKGLVGIIKAFLRPKIQRQTSCDQLLSLFDKFFSARPFAGQRALVIGGSRGLGEVFAKVLAMGGAEVLLTYYKGEKEAATIIYDIRNNGGIASNVQYDVTAREVQQLAAFAPTHLYYMATPFIGSGQRGKFNADAFERFSQYYVSGFATTLEIVRHDSLLKVYYPSSVFLDEMPADMTEYIAAKSAGEALCATLTKAYPRLGFFYPRLPRIATDQSASLLPCVNQSVLPLVMEQLEQFLEEV